MPVQDYLLDLDLNQCIYVFRKLQQFRQMVDYFYDFEGKLIGRDHRFHLTVGLTAFKVPTHSRGHCF